MQQAVARPVRQNGEAELLANTYEQSETYFANNPDEAANLLGIGQRPIPSDVDQGSAALVLDREQRGILEDTLVIWGGEFGRTPMGQNGDGRDHHIQAFSMWMAGAGIKPGIIYGETDPFGYNIIRDEVHVHDFHATIMHLMGIDHEKLRYRYQGRDFRLTDVHGHVVKNILACD